MLNRLFQRRTRENALSTNSVDFGMLEKKLEDPLAMPMYLPLDFLKSITRDFSEEQELGRGGFGVVYKGILQNGKTIAVKKLSEMHLDDNRFHNEVTYLIGAKHENIVELLGYCAESRWEATQVSGKYVMAEIRHRLICFEYINNKSLDEYISAADCGLNWHQRFGIIRGICDGLQYLHKECNIIHLDLKPQNILMDENMVPKIADFGMSRMFGQQQSRIITKSCRGTYGYMAPEYLTNGLISTKSDMFCLGVIMIELLTGSRDYPQNSEPCSREFLYNVVEKWTNRLGSSPVLSDIYEISACTAIGLRCVDSDPEKRPDAWDIIEMLHDATSTGFPRRLNGTSSGDFYACRISSVGIPFFLSASGLLMPCSADYKPMPTRPSWDEEPLLRCSMYLSNKKPAPSSSASVLPYKTANVRDHYRIGKELGQGLSGTTYRCFRKADGAEYACKSIPKHKLNKTFLHSLLRPEGYAKVWREIQIMHHLSDHPNVVRIQGAYEDALFVHIVMELCAGGNLLDRIVSKQGRYSERAAAQLIRNIVGVVDGCHSLGVIHGNLSPENLLFDSYSEDAALKATGFGCSAFYMPGDTFSTIIGSTSYYVAPEVLLQKCYAGKYIFENAQKHVRDKERRLENACICSSSLGQSHSQPLSLTSLTWKYGPEADIWSVGVILYILLSGVPPFWAETEGGTSSEILQGKLDFESDPWPSISDSAKDLIRNMLTQDPIKRFSAHEVLCHPWIIDDAVAPDKPTDSAVLSSLKHYSTMSMFTKMVSQVIAETMIEEEIGGLKELFKKFDTDNSRNITFDELKDGLKRLGSALSEAEIQMLMDAADIDSSGAVGCAEFVAATLHMNKLEREENLLRAFSFFDKDGNGYITTDELSEACRKLGVDVVHLEDIIQDIDQNNDGKIDYSEFVAMMRKGNAAESSSFGVRGEEIDYSEFVEKKERVAPSVRSQQALPRWSPPPQGWSKINVDGSFVSGTCEAGVGVVARNSRGEVLFTAWRALSRCASAPVAEAAAAVEGIKLAVQWLHTPLIFESDCARIVKAMNSKRKDKSEIGFLIVEGKELALALGDWKFHLVKRESNRVANDLALLARRTKHSAAWLSDSPMCVRELLADDCSILHA